MGTWPPRGMRQNRCQEIESGTRAAGAAYPLGWENYRACMSLDREEWDAVAALCGAGLALMGVGWTLIPLWLLGAILFVTQVPVEQLTHGLGHPRRDVHAVGDMCDRDVLVALRRGKQRSPHRSRHLTVRQARLARPSATSLAEIRSGSSRRPVLFSGLPFRLGPVPDGHIKVFGKMPAT